MPDLWGFATIAAKFGMYLGILTASGTLFATLLFQLKGTARFAVSFALMGLVATLLSFGLRGAALTGDLSGMIDQEMLMLLWSTPVGDAFLYRVAGLSVLIIGAMIGGWGLRVGAIGGASDVYRGVDRGAHTAQATRRGAAFGDAGGLYRAELWQVCNWRGAGLGDCGGLSGVCVDWVLVGVVSNGVRASLSD